jgi:hypothetical protein
MKKKIYVILRILSLILCILVYFQVLKYFELTQLYTPITTLDKGIKAIVTISAVFLALAIHELGHLISGMKQGFEFKLFVVGILGIKKNNHNKIKIYLNRNLGQFFGVVGVQPKEMAVNIADKMASVCISGPIASLIYAVVCFAFYHYNSILELTPFIQHILSVSMAASLAIFFATVIPNKTGVLFSDRKRYQRLKSTGVDRDSELSLISLAIKTSTEKSYKNIDLDDVQKLKASNDDMSRCFGSIYAYGFYVENGDFEKAEKEKTVLYQLEEVGHYSSMFIKEIKRINSKAINDKTCR